MGHEKKLAIANGETLAGHYPRGADWNAPIEKITLVEMFGRAVKKYADHPCIDFLGTKISFRELEELTDKAAKGFQDMGVTKGTRVGFYMPNTQWHPVLFFGALKAGAIIVNFSPAYAEKELLQQVENSGTSILVTADVPKPENTYGNAVHLLKQGKLQKILAFNLADTLPKDRSWLPREMKWALPVVKIINRLKNLFDCASRGKITYLNSFIKNDGRYKPVPLTPDDTAVLQYTGGTTGVPKGAELTHYNLTANVQQIAIFAADGPGKPKSEFTLKAGKTRMFSPLPYFHVFGMTSSMLMPIYLGMETVMTMNPRDLETSLKIIDRTKPDATAAVPKLVEAAIHSKLLAQYDHSTLRSVVTGGAATPERVQATVKEKCLARIIPGWGLTETAPVLTVVPPYGAVDNPGAGQPLPGVEIRVCDISDPTKVLILGEHGELQARGPNIMKGYWNRPDETANVMVEGGWFRTGDIGVITEDGYIHITDRLKRMINVNGTGKKAFPLVIENEIALHENVAECVVIAVNKGTERESAKAFVRAKPGKTVSENELRDFLKTRLSPLEVPKHFEFVTEPLPVTTIGKPDWKKLEDMEALKTAAKKIAPAPAL